VFHVKQSELETIEAAIAARSRRFRTFDDKVEHGRYMALALAGEVGELLNLIKKDWRGDSPPDLAAKLKDEASDVFVYWLLFCKVQGWSVAEMARHADTKAARKIVEVEAVRASRKG
jgi:NTP pyrophosphatase (non-canonical NTP hydrolase)